MNFSVKIVAFFTSLAAFFTTFVSSVRGDVGKIETLQYAITGDAYQSAGEDMTGIHDPSLFRAEDGTYYIYGSHIASAKSDDLIHWQNISGGVCDNNRTLVPEGSTLRETLSEVFEWTDAYQAQQNKELYDSIKAATENGESPELNGWETNVWASDVFYNKTMKKYCYYAASSVWGTPHSVVWFAVSDTPDGTFEYRDCIYYSGMDRKTNLRGGYENYTNYNYSKIPELIENKAFSKFKFEHGKFFTKKGWYDCSYEKGPNCIDPHVFYDKDDNLWMVYGSFSGGIFVVPLVEETGLPDYKAMKKDKKSVVYYGRQITFTSDANTGTGEGPYITYDAATGYYYFFQTYGGLGEFDGYNMRVYRSENPEGPYYDKMGNQGTDVKNTGLKISGNYRFSTDSAAYLSGGHNSVIVDEDGKVFNCYHVRFDDGSPYRTVIHQMVRTSDGWLTMLPLEYTGETAEPVSAGEIQGRYELVDFDSITINFGENTTDSDDIVTPAQTVSFNPDGTITGFRDYHPTAHNTKAGSEEVSGTWTVEEGTYFVSLRLGSVDYTGVAVKADDGRMMLSFTGSDNSGVWAISQ